MCCKNYCCQLIMVLIINMLLFMGMLFLALFLCCFSKDCGCIKLILISVGSLMLIISQLEVLYIVKKQIEIKELERIKDLIDKLNPPIP